MPQRNGGAKPEPVFAIQPLMDTLLQQQNHWSKAISFSCMIIQSKLTKENSLLMCCKLV
jgi:hypothetical protein